MLKCFMRLSQAFMPILKEEPQGAEIISHKLMLRSGMITMMAKGIYAWLPLGAKMLNKLCTIINTEMQKIDFEEIIMPTLQPANLWERSGRYESYGKEMLRMLDRHNVEFVYGPTAEECVTDIFDRAKIKYTALPTKLYNIQWKFRDEIRPRFGILRSREFLMKDGYTFDVDYDKALQTYKQVFNAYIEIFTKMGLKVQPAVAANGVMGGEMSHDFHVLSEVGENVLFYDKAWENIIKPTWDDITTLYSVSEENHTQTDRTDLISHKSIEVGHNFLLGVKYTQSMNVKVQTAQGLIEPIMGCYGIGVSRLVGAIIEANHDEKGIVWPKQISPYDLIILNLGANKTECIDFCNTLYAKLKHSYDVLYDDNNVSAGQKFATADLLGMPWQIIVGVKELEMGIVKIKVRNTGEIIECAVDSIMDKIQKFINA